MRRLAILPLLLLGGREATSHAPPPCEDWLAAVSCGDNDLEGYMDCSIFEDCDHDIADYFDCLTDHTVCDAETQELDTSGWGECVEELGECAENGTIPRCELEFVSMTCGGFALRALADCERLDRYGCDLAPYYDCLRANTGCDEEHGVPDVSQWSSCDDLLDAELDACSIWESLGCNGT